MSMEVVRLSGSLGAEVRGVKLGAVDPSRADEIKALLTEHLVLFFPEQFLSPRSTSPMLGTLAGSKGIRI